MLRCCAVSTTSSSMSRPDTRAVESQTTAEYQPKIKEGSSLSSRECKVGAQRWKRSALLISQYLVSQVLTVRGMVGTCMWALHFLFIIVIIIYIYIFCSIHDNGRTLCYNWFQSYTWFWIYNCSKRYSRCREGSCRAHIQVPTVTLWATKQVTDDQPALRRFTYS